MGRTQHPKPDTGVTEVRSVEEAGGRARVVWMIEPRPAAQHPGHVSGSPAGRNLPAHCEARGGAERKEILIGDYAAAGERGRDQKASFHRCPRGQNVTPDGAPGPGIQRRGGRECLDSSPGSRSGVTSCPAGQPRNDGEL